MTDKVSTAMMEKWNATPFDETDRIEQVAERARQFLVNAALDKISELDAENGEEAIHPEIYQPMPPMPTDEEIAALAQIEGDEI